MPADRDPQNRDPQNRDPQTSAEHPGKAASAIGTDEWVAQVEDRKRRRSGPWGRLADSWEALPATWRYGLVVALLLLAPLATGTPAFLELMGISNNAFIIRTLTRFLVFAMLAVGLNVVVGYAGLLDLGYTAFYGIAGYLYAYLSSSFVKIGGLDGLHLPSLISIPLIIMVTALIGWLLGSLSLRLSGDYLAIVTLGFGQVFVQLALTATRVKLPWRTRPVDFTRGPNGINRLDDISLFGFTLHSTLQYYYLFLLFLILLFVAVHRLNHSRIGRAWRAIREDELAAEVMGAPAGRLKLLAFAIGAAIAALAGTVGAAWQGNVVPVPRYSVLTLINLYAMVVLGGLGSLPGVVLGAFIFTVLPEVLRSIALAGVLFYGGGLLGLYLLLRPWRRFALMLAGAVIGGLGIKGLAHLLWPGLDTGILPGSSPLNQLVRNWLVIPVEFKVIGNIITILAILLTLLVILVRRRPSLFYPLLGVTIYLASFAWETRLALEPAATRILILGVSLVVLMIARPQGLLGKAEVRVV